MILVLTGTHHQGFDRLVLAADALARLGEEVVVQAGASTVVTRAARAQPWFSPEELRALAARAEVIVSHTGPASLMWAWELGKRPVVVPRSPRFGEHVDDHQQRFAAHLGDRAVVTSPGRLVADWARVRAAARVPLDVAATSGGAAVDALSAALSRLHPQAGGWRASLRRALYKGIGR